jgi:peptide/nickel transport system permease protein
VTRKSLVCKTNFLKRRIIIAILAFLVVLNLDFVLPRLAPGSAAVVFASGSEIRSQQTVQIIIQRLGLNKPLTIQYFLYLKGIFATWPPYFGVSYQYFPQTVTNLIAYKLPWTLLLILSSLALSFIVSFSLVILTALRRGTVRELATLYVSIFFWATPAFWIAMILLWLFGIYFHWLPVFGNATLTSGSGLNFVISVLDHAVLPILTLTAAIFGLSYYLFRGASQDILQSDYLLAAKARGLRNSTILTRYVFRNSMLPVVSLLGYFFATLISIEIVVEAVFSYPGMGDLLVDAIFNRDYPVLEGGFFFVSVFVIAFTLLGDFLLTRLDPRLRT